MFRFLFLFFLSNFILFSQDEDLDKLPYNDTPVEQQNRNYFVIGGGFSINYYMLNVDEYNNLMKNQFGLGEFKSGMIMQGGVGFTGLPITKNLRVGVRSVGGSNQITSNKDKYSIDQTLSLNMTGITIDYGYILTNHLALLLGAEIGWGNTNLHLSKGLQNKDWGSLNPNLDDSTYNFSLDKNFAYFSPHASIEWAATSFLMFRFMASYNVAFDNPFSGAEDKSWRLNNVTTISNTPNKLSNSGINFEFGIFLGLFNY